MTHTHDTMHAPKAILRAWMPFKKAVGVTSVRTKADYRRALAMIDMLLDEVGDDESHPLADVLDFLSDRVREYEDENIVIPEAEPREVLRFLMTRHGLTQSDLADCAPQGRISDILGGRREISKEVAKKLAQRFGVRADVFL
ncbi:MAG: helix-turn-helix domain-containing protein [Chromatiales bacterium]|jgi:HTH-type transcriptional regulator/antitoxin HigA|nr:helix-turn-helix domain-containing protein [Chromatiales bacterium]MDX9766749.1 helix-turn-helix domain-containing protein [Ectothiorhodospiraceae bacterium]